MSQQISQAIIPEVQHEAASTQKILERIPMHDPQWKPHAKSMALGRLATHVAELPSWISMTIDTDELNWAEFKYNPPTFSTNEELVGFFNDNVQKAIASLQNSSDENLMKPWTMRNGDHIFFTMPKIAVIRSFAMNHLIHHRAQLTVYLRLNDIPVPGLYGPSADDK